MEFTFTNINKDVPSKKYYFIIDVSNKKYKSKKYKFYLNNIKYIL